MGTAIPWAGGFRNPLRVIPLIAAVVECRKLRIQVGQRTIQLIGVALVLAGFQIALYSSSGKQ